MGIPVGGGSPAQTCQDLDAVDPESRPDVKAANVLAPADVWTPRPLATRPEDLAPWHLTHVEIIAAWFPASFPEQLPRVVVVNELQAIHGKAMVEDDTRKHPVLAK